MTLKVLELFSGAGSFSINLKSNKIKHEIIGFSDIRESAVRLFCEILDKDISENLGDINKLKATELDVDLLVFGSPCQSFSRTGKGEGGVKGSNTKSSLMWEAVRIMKECNPKYIIWENVSDAVNKKHKPNFIEYMSELCEMNYNTYYTVLNAHDFGSAEKRKRLFSVSIRKDIDNGNFKFLELKKEPKKLIDYLDEKVGDEFKVEEKIANSLILNKNEKGLMIKNATKLGYLYANEGDAVDTGFYNSKTRRGRVQKEACPTLLRSKTVATVRNNELYYLTPKEIWRLHELPEEMYQYVEKLNFTMNELYDVIGGTINQKHLDIVFNSLSECFKWEKE